MVKTSELAFCKTLAMVRASILGTRRKPTTQPNKLLTSPSIYFYCSLAVLPETRVVLRFAATTTS